MIQSQFLRVLSAAGVSTSAILTAIALTAGQTVAAPADASPDSNHNDLQLLAQNVPAGTRVVVGQVEAISGDRVRLKLADGSSLLIGVTLNDRDRLNLSSGDTITAVLTNRSFFARAVESGRDTLVVTKSGRIRTVTVEREGEARATSSSTSTSTTRVTRQRTTRTTTVRQEEGSTIRGLW